MLTKCLFRLEQSWKYLHNIKTFCHSLESLPHRIFALQCLPYILRCHVKTDKGQWTFLHNTDYVDLLQDSLLWKISPAKELRLLSLGTAF